MKVKSSSSSDISLTLSLFLAVFVLPQQQLNPQPCTSLIPVKTQITPPPTHTSGCDVRPALSPPRVAPGLAGASPACPPRINSPVHPATPLLPGKSRPHPTAATTATATPSDLHSDFFIFFPWDTQGHADGRILAVGLNGDCVCTMEASRPFLDKQDGNQQPKGASFTSQVFLLVLEFITKGSPF